MSTANAIEAITDAGDFEILATRVLRQVDPDYVRVEHLGVNADGKTVKNPLDGFCRVPGSRPSRYVMGAFSTDAADKIGGKLLFDHTKSKGKKYKDSDDGDLIKAARSAADIRKQEDDAEFIFTFCTNKQPNDKLMKLGYAAGKTMGIEVRFLARSAIRDHLDTKRDGQWLRKEHLGIAADTLSIPLLQELAAESVQQYSHELFCSDAQIIETATTKRLATLTSQNQPSVNVLIGASGSGKSVASYQMLADVIANGGIALWMPAEVTAKCVSLDAAIASTLQSLCPTLGPEAGRDSVTLTANLNIPFVLVVDDVNRTTNATQEVQKLISWHRRMAAGKTAKGAASQSDRVPHLIIPVWNHYWSSIAGRHRDSGTIGEVTAQPMNSDEARECLRACSNQDLDHESASEVVRRLEHDPILIGLWGKLYGDKPAEHLDAEASTLIEDYIERSIDEDSADGKYLPADIRGALETLAARILGERDFYPAWSRVSEWLNDSQLGALRHISVSGKICRVVRRNDIDRFEFRHDRLLEAAIANPLSKCLSDIDNNRDIISDPFFTDSIARTVVATGDPELIDKLREYAPLVVLRVIRHVTDPETAFAKASTVAATQWLVEATTKNTTPSEMVFVASRILEATQNPLVLAVTEDVKDDHRFAGARLVNGDAIRGKFFVASPGFYPGSRAPFIEDVVANALRLYRNRLCKDLAAELESGPHSDGELHAALILAGYIGESSLAEPVLSAWKHDRDNQCLLEALWASIRCSTEPEITLAPLLDSWATLSDERDHHSGSERTQFLTELEFCMRHGVNECVVEFLANRAKDDDRLSGCISALLQRIDHPIAVTSVATRVARIEKEIEGKDNYSHWASECRHNWDPLNRQSNRLSDVSRISIMSLSQKSEEEWLKKSLLRTWVATTDSVDELRALPEEVATSRSVLWRRARLGDLSIVDIVLERLEDEFNWWRVIPPIWTDRFTDALDTALRDLGEKAPNDFSGGLSDDHYCLSQVLRDIPLEVAGELLLRHWELLKFSACFLQVALYIGGESLLLAAEAVMKDAPDDWEPFRFVGYTFGFKMIGLQDRLTDKHVDALLPYVERLSDSDLMEIAEWLVERGREDDFRDHVSVEINRRRESQHAEGENSYIIRVNRANFPSDAELLDGLTRIEEDEQMVWIWCRYATERGDTPERIRGLLRTWLLDKPSPERLKIVARIVLELGQRQDVADLQEYQTKYGDDSTKIVVDGATFAVQYRTLF